MEDEPQGIVDVDETMLRAGESMNLSLSGAHTPVWLMRLPPDLSRIWKVQHQYQGQTVAQMKIPKEGTNGKIVLQIAPELVRKNNFDSSYEVKLTKEVVNNEYVFTESEYTQFKEENGEGDAEYQDSQQRNSSFMTQVAALPQQPKLKSLNKEEFYHEARWTRKSKEDDPNGLAPASGIGTTDFNEPVPKGRWSKRGFIPFARTIPKKTEIVGKIVHECQVVPLRLAANDKLRLQAQRRHLKSLVKKTSIKIIDNKEVGKMHGKSTPNIQTGATMVMSKVEQMKKLGQREEGRHARMDKRDLMAKIFDCFRRFEYWSIKNLKAKLKQPEQWLRENLEEVAAMEKGGTFTQKWRLKEEYRRTIQAQNKGFDEDDEGDENDQNNANDDEDSDMDLEDVAAI